MSKLNNEFLKAREKAFEVEWNSKKSIERILWNKCSEWTYDWVMENMINQKEQTPIKPKK